MRLNERESGIFEDFEALLERLVPCEQAEREALLAVLLGPRGEQIPFFGRAGCNSVSGSGSCWCPSTALRSLLAADLVGGARIRTRFSRPASSTSYSNLPPWPASGVPEGTVRRSRSRLRSSRRRDGERPLGGQRRAGQLRPPQAGDRGRGRGPDRLPAAKPARDPVRAQRLPLPRSLPDLRHARVDQAPLVVVQRVQHALLARQRRVLSPGCRGRAPAGRETGRLLLRAGRVRSWRRARARRSRRSARPPSRAYHRLVEAGVARELARTVLPVASYTEFYWTVNARSLMNFLSLRNAETAQREIRRYAEAIESLFAERMPITHAAFVAAGRTAAVVAQRRSAGRRRTTCSGSRSRVPPALAATDQPAAWLDRQVGATQVDLGCAGADAEVAAALGRSAALDHREGVALRRPRVSAARAP